jgi:hypothetical protein
LSLGYKRFLDINNSFLIKFPELIKYWDFDNNEVNPYTLGPNSNYIAQWTCRFQHNISTSIRVRTRNIECRECVKLIGLVSGSLYARQPLIAKDWDYEKNYPISPMHIKPRHRKKVWWLCPEKKHSYCASPDNRVGNGSRCPECYKGGPKKKKYLNKNNFKNIAP